MALPVKPLSTGSVKIAGESVEIRSLSRREVLKLKEYENDLDAAEAFIIACGTGESVEAVNEWRASIDAFEVEPLLEAIAKISGLQAPKA